MLTVILLLALPGNIRPSTLFLAFAAIPFIFYSIALYSSWHFFRRSRSLNVARPDFTPPVSILKPVRGIDPEAYENFASTCRQDYPDYELIFCVGNNRDPVLPVIEKLARDFPARSIRVVFGITAKGASDKAAKLAHLTAAAQHEVLVIADSDVRVQPDYLRSVVAPLADPAVGAVTCLYAAADQRTFTEQLHTIGMISDLYAGILTAWQLDGVKFALGPTIVTTKTRLAEFGGYAALENRLADDLLVGRLIAEGGHEVRLLPYTLVKLAGYQSFRELLDKRLRWMTVMRHMRPWGHLGLIFTQGLAWSLLAIAVRPTAPVIFGFLGTYLAFRIAITWLIGVWGMKQSGIAKRLPLIPPWDAFACSIWLASFLRNRVQWRDQLYHIRAGGMLVPVATPPAKD
jgi:ceramide glucosyltransferase